MCTQLTEAADQQTRSRILTSALAIVLWGIGTAARRLWRAYWTWYARRATVRILHSLDAGTLRDIGVNPSEIESFVYGTCGDRKRCYDESWLWRCHR